MQVQRSHRLDVSKPLLRIENLTVEMRTPDGVTELVRDVSMDVRRGEVLGLVGESGAGKSVTGAAIAGLLALPLVRAAGRIFLEDDALHEFSEREMRHVRGARIATIFQDPSTSLNPVFSIGRQLIETIRLHNDVSRREARAQAVSLMQQVGITAAEERLDRYAHEFSGGMRQRVVIALALAGNPSLIIADEPTTALDVSVQAQILALLKSLQRERGLSIVMVTHDMGVIEEIADRVAVMYAGRIVEVGPVSEMIGASVHPYTQGLMRSIPVLGQGRARLSQIPGSMPRPDSVGTGCSFAPRCLQRMSQCAQRPRLAPTQGMTHHQHACWLQPVEMKK